MIDDRRKQKLVRVARARLGHVHCAIESVYHRHNASAVLRTCDAVGIQHVHLVGTRSFYPSVGASKGTGRWLTLHVHKTAHEAISAIHAAGLQIWVADFADPPTPPERVPVEHPICLWFGAELAGVSEEVRAVARGVMTLPMHGFAQSLNVSVAAALALYSVTGRARDQLGEAAKLRPAERADLLTQWLERDVVEFDHLSAEQHALALLGEAFDGAVISPSDRRSR